MTLRVSNTLRDAPASIHWHGILLPANMDGVPGLSFNGILPEAAGQGTREARLALGVRFWF